MDKQGKLIVVSAPSGSGKTTLVKHLLETLPGLAFSVSATSRAIRPGEVHGKDYYFLTPEQFRRKADAGEFLEWEEVYPGIFYGTLKSDVAMLTAQGLHVVFDVDVVGGLNIKNYFGERALALFIMAPSVEALAARLRARSTESEETLNQRIGKATREMEFAGRFDKIIVNDRLDDAKVEIVRIVNEFLAR
ncbi:MAG: guanylate kinase [Bacteroidetes bacterium]|nr:guanylate kinase [Bacteroidota bacterium]